MPLPQTEKSTARRASNPARIMLNSPLAAAMRTRVYRQRTRQLPSERGRRVIGMVGALLVHLVFLVAFVLGPAYPPPPFAPAKPQMLQVRLIELPPPPPPVRGSPPREVGPVHQGHSQRIAAVSERSTNIENPAAPTPASAAPALAPAPVAAAVPVQPRIQPPAATPVPPRPSVSKLAPKLAPTPKALIARAAPPPTLQPEPVRKPQPEGNRPMLPPTQLVLSKVPLSSARVEVSPMALPIQSPITSAPLSEVPAPAAAAPTSVVPDIPLGQADLIAPVPLATRVPSPTPALALGRAELHLSAPAIAAPPPPVAAEAPPEPVQTIRAAAVTLPAMQPALMHPTVSTPTVAAPLTPPAPATPSAASATAESAPAPALAGPPDVSRAPDAVAQGSDSATVGQANGAAAAPVASSSRTGTVTQASIGQGRRTGQGQTSSGAGQIGGNQSGAAQGENRGTVGDYVQVKPHGDTQIMNHGAPNIGYHATRFEQDWTPENESSVDTVLRRAVEKTTLKHTFHLPQGIRVECAVMPLLPMSLLGCRNPDPPPQPVADKVYDRLHLAPANPVAAPAVSRSATSVSAPAMVKFDNSAECATARVAGGPPPPGCEPSAAPVRPRRGPAASSSSWVPASDQFH